MVERTPADLDDDAFGTVTRDVARRGWLTWMLLGAAATAVVAALVLGALGLSASSSAGRMAQTAGRVAAVESALAELRLAPSGADPSRLADVRQRLREVEAGLSPPQAVREAGIRADALLVQAERLLGRGEEGSGIEEASGRLLEAVRILEDARAAASAAADEQLAAASSRWRAGVAAAALGLVLGAAGLLVVVLERRREGEQDQVHRLSQLLAAAVRSTEEGILITDTGEGGGDPSIVFLNRSFGEMIGFLADDLIGQPLQMLRERHMKEQEFSLLEHSFSDSRSATMETVRWREDGSSLHCEWHISPVRDAGGRVTHFVSVLRDITQRRQHEVALERTARELADANRRLKENQAQLVQSEKMAFLGQLAAGVAHEINNPVGYVMSNLQTLRDDLERQLGGEGLDAEMREMLAESLAGLEQVRDIVSRLKNFARPDEAEPELANVNEVIEGSIRIVWNELKHRCTVHKELGEAPEILCRPGQLGQVFTNLLVNAAQAITDHGLIRISSRANGEEITVVISDTGAGISEEHLPVVFTPFFTTKPPGKGTGLGLAVSYGIVTAHGGTIEVASRPGEGSRFTVRLPLRTPFEQASPGVRSSGARPRDLLDGSEGGR